MLSSGYDIPHQKLVVLETTIGRGVTPVTVEIVGTKCYCQAYTNPLGNDFA